MKKKMKKWFLLLFVIFVMTGITRISSMAAEKASGTCGDNLTWILDEEGTLTVSGTGEMQKYDYDEYPWSTYYDEVTSIVIEDHVATISDCAFRDFYKVTNVELNSELTSIGAAAFASCFELSEIELPSSVMSIGLGAFAESGLTSIVIPLKVTSISAYTFVECWELKNITIPSSVTSIGEGAFEGCSGLKSITIPSGVTTIERCTFSDCNELTSITIPSGVITIGDYAFSSCSGLKSITIPSGVTTIGEGAFNECSELTNITIPESVTVIEDYTFSGCSSITGITIPSDVENIGTGVFRQCSNLEKITVADENKNYLAEDGVLFNKDKTILICYPNGKTNESYTIPSGVITIGEYAFSANKFLKSLIIPASVATIEDYALGDSWDENDPPCYQGTIKFEGNMPELKWCFSEGMETTIYYPNTWTSVPDESEHGVDPECGDIKWISYAAGNILDTPKLSSVSNTSKGVTIKWAKVTGAAKYRVFRKTSSSSWKKVGDTASTSYTDTTAKSGTTYTYTVRCLISDGTTYTSSYDKTGKSIEYIAQPALSSVTNASTGVTVKWAKVTGAAKYRVFRKTGSGSWAKVGDTTSTSYTDTTAKSGTTYTYTVRCITSDGKTYTSSYDTTGKSIKYLSRPKLSSASNTSSGVTVKWGKVTGASGYYVYRKTSSGNYSKIATIKSGSTVSYSDTAVKSKNGTKYIYTVRAYSGKTLSSYESGKTIVRLTSSSISSLKNSATKKMTVKWAQNSKVTGYQVQYSTSSKFSSATTKTISGYKNVSKTITGLTKGKTYYVRVRGYKTVSGVKYYSAWSAVKSVKISK